MGSEPDLLCVVTTGVYRLTRNPMYLGFALPLAGGGVYLGHLLALLLVPAFVLCVNRFQIGAEERVLLQHFGAPHAEYLRSERRCSAAPVSARLRAR